MSGISYLDNVPVKIVEKYKIPPPIYQLPQTIKNKLLDSTICKCEYNYDSQLEHHVLSSLTEWRRIRQEMKCLRQERIKKREQILQQKAEVLQKQILEAISYPSTDDLSMSSDSEKDLAVDTNKPICAIDNNFNSFYNILKPTVLSIKEPDAEVVKSTNPSKHDMEYSHGKTATENSFNFRDFEADTSSPFDNIELKTINDLDILAQVLHNTQVENSIPKNITKSPESHTELPSELKINSISNEDCNQRIIPNEPKSCMPAMPVFSTITCNNENNINQENCDYIRKNVTESQLNYDLNAKSMSVPNIVKGLSENLQIAALRRSRVKSINMGKVDDKLNVVGDGSRHSDGNNDKYFHQLDDMGKTLVKNICDMGFPRERVSRVALLLGFDDKKIIEHLIPCTELADIGFNETDISDALLRYNNNKEKALEDLIS